MGMYNSQVIVSVSIPSILIVFTYVFKMMISLVCAADRRSVWRVCGLFCTNAADCNIQQIAVFSRLLHTCLFSVSVEGTVSSNIPSRD